jgi:hypothetical protein
MIVLLAWFGFVGFTWESTHSIGLTNLAALFFLPALLWWERRKN